MGTEWAELEAAVRQLGTEIRKASRIDDLAEAILRRLPNWML